MITEYKLEDAGREMLITVKRSSRKTLGLEVRENGEIFARIPEKLSDRSLKSFIEKERDWIIKKSELVKWEREHRQTTNATPVQELTSEEIENISQKIVDRVRFYQKKMGVTVGRVAIRNQKTQWGSCSAKGNLNFNYQIYYLPDELLDYVVVHELAHRRHMNHSDEFWREVEKYFPMYRQCRKRLKEIRLIN